MNRPALRWHGGKFILAKWIISHFPVHRIYVEPFAGAASVMLQKDRSYAEVLNDLNDDLVNYFYCLRVHRKELVDAVVMTPFARREFDMAHTFHPHPVERARRLLIRSFMGFGADAASDKSRSTGFRSNSNRSHTTPAHDWMNLPQGLEEISERLRGVVIENRDWLECCQQHDAAETLFYLDPPYLETVRKRYGAYGSFEIGEEEHRRILDFAQNCKGKVVISGYASELYDDVLKDWRRELKHANADGARKREEVLWIKP